MTVSLERRLLRFLDREDVDERRSSHELRALSPDERVLEGECIQGAILEAVEPKGAHVFRAEENLSKFREGDALVVSDGFDFEGGCWLTYGSYEVASGRIVLQPDRFSRRPASDRPSLAVGQTYCIDRRSLGLGGRLRAVVTAGFEDERVCSVLEGRHQPSSDPARHQRAEEKLAACGLNEGQIAAGAAAMATEDLALIQGPPGTGKTRLLAEIVSALCAAGCRVALCAFTHRAVDNALFMLRRQAPELPLFKLGYPSRRDGALRTAGVRFLDPRRGGIPAKGVVVGSTCYQLAKLPSSEKFHFTVFDEAGQLPIPHAIPGMLLSKRWIFVGDHQQLPPVITARHVDGEVTSSIFEHLNRHYGSELLNVTYRLNDKICSAVSQMFYEDRLRSSEEAAVRRMSFVPGGHLDEVLDPEKGAVLARVDHRQPGMRSSEEASLIADLVAECRQRHQVPASEIAIIAPFRSQIRQIRSALQRKEVDDSELMVDTVERIQGQERDVVLVSLAVGDPDSLKFRAAFFFSTNRLNVALSRARCKAILVASRGAFQALPMDAASLAAASGFKKLYRILPQVDLTAVYASP